MENQNPIVSRRTTKEQEILELAVARVHDALIAYPLGFRRQILQEALRRIPAEVARAEEAEIDATFEVLCGRRSAANAGLRFAGALGTPRRDANS